MIAPAAGTGSCGLPRRPHSATNARQHDNTAANMKPHRGTLILVLGILSLVVCSPLGIFAWIMGSNDLREMDAGTMDPSGRDTTKAGRICGIIGTVLLALSVLIGIGFVLLLAVGAAAHH